MEDRRGVPARSGPSGARSAAGARRRPRSCRRRRPPRPGPGRTACRRPARRPWWRPSSRRRPVAGGAGGAGGAVVAPGAGVAPSSVPSRSSPWSARRRPPRRSCGPAAASSGVLKLSSRIERDRRDRGGRRPRAWAASAGSARRGARRRARSARRRPRSGWRSRGPAASVETAVLMPMTLPVASRSGPPLLPGLIAASVWSRPVSVTGRPVASSWTVIVRPVADRMPLVTVSVNVPSGLPMAMTVWPTWSVAGVADGGRAEAGRVDLDQGEVLVVGLLDDRRRELARRRRARRSASGCRPRRACWSGCSRPR